MTATASGPATARRNSAAPRGSMTDTRRPVSARVNEAQPRVDLVAPEGAIERIPVARVLRAVQR